MRILPCWWRLESIPILLAPILALTSGSAATPPPWTVLDQKLTEDGKFFAFATRPDIQAPVWEITIQDNSSVAPGYWFIAPYEVKTQEVPGEPWVGPHIYDEAGDLVWSGAPQFGHWNVFDFGPTEIDGELHLSGLDWHGQRGVVLDSSYHIERTASALAEGDTFMNMHGFHVVDNGEHALVQTVHQWDVPPNITHASTGYNGTCEAHYQGFREVDLHTQTGDRTIFHWDAHKIGLNEATYFTYGPTAETMCKRGWDLLHVNAVDKCPDGDYLLSARHTDTLYKISHTTGDIVWRLGGVMSDFEFMAGAKFSRQHHARCQQQNATHTLISLFDNAVGEHYAPPSRHNSRGLILSLDLGNRTASIASQYEDPLLQLIDGRGSFQLLPNGNAFVGWAVSSRISEHLSNGTVVLLASLKSRVDSYRAFKSPWTGRPNTSPDVHSEIVWKNRGKVVTVVSMSWNGATEIDHWNVKGQDTEGSKVDLANRVQRTGFETTIQYRGFVTDMYAEAMDRDGKLLGTSSDTRAVPPRHQASRNSLVWPAIGGCLAALVVGTAGLFGYRYFKQRRQVQEKGLYKAVEQEEEPIPQ